MKGLLLVTALDLVGVDTCEELVEALTVKFHNQPETKMLEDVKVVTLQAYTRKGPINVATLRLDSASIDMDYHITEDHLTNVHIRNIVSIINTTD